MANLFRSSKESSGGLVLDSLTVSQLPDKIIYNVGENLDLTGIEVTASAGILSGDVSSLAAFTPPDNTQLNTQGTQAINVSYENVSTSFDVSVYLRPLIKQLPYSFELGSALVYNDEIHLLGGNNNGKKHYKWNGANWIDLDDCPSGVWFEAATVHNGLIYAILNDNSNAYLYSFNGTSWTLVNTLPYLYSNKILVSYNNQLHIMGNTSTSYLTRHYRWNGTNWASASTLPYDVESGATALVYNNEIHLLGGNATAADRLKHYKWNGSSWSSVSTLPYSYYGGAAIVFDGNLHILGGGYPEVNREKHYKWDGSNWEDISTLPYKLSYGRAVAYANEIRTIGGGTQSAEWNKSSWYMATN